MADDDDDDDGDDDDDDDDDCFLCVRHCRSCWRCVHSCASASDWRSRHVSDVSTSRGRSWRRDLPGLISPQTHLHACLCKSASLRWLPTLTTSEGQACIDLTVSKRAAVSRPTFWSKASKVVRVPSWNFLDLSMCS